jgi:hypothetical protein
MARVVAPWSAMGSSPEREGRGRGRGRGGTAGGAPWRAWGGAARSSSAPAASRSFSVRDYLYVRESRKEEGERRRKRKGRKRKEKIWKIF